MAIMDFLISLISGLIAGVWIMFFYLWLSKLHSIGRLPKLASLLIAPALLWFAIAFGILFEGTHIPDWLGMNMLVSGIVVFLASAVTVAVSLITTKVLPVCCVAILGAMTLNLVFVVLRM